MNLGFHKLTLFLALATAWAVCSSPSTSDAACSVERLRCEYRTDPLGIDEIEPRLSWTLQSGEFGQAQKAYQVLVASSPEALAGNSGDLWDSGRIESDNSTAIVYSGESLRSGQRCYWKVRIWDQDDNPSAWSTPAMWSMGLLKPSDWQAEWIGYDAERVIANRDANFEGASWICHPEDDPTNAPAGHRMYLAKFDVPEGAAVRGAEVLAVADNKLWLAVNGKMIVHGEPGWKQVKPVSLTEVVRVGENEIRINVNNESPGPTGLLVRLTVQTEDGESVVLVTDKSWLAYDSPGELWPYGDWPTSGLKSCHVVGEYGRQPWGKSQIQDLFLPSVPQFRTEFQTTQPVAAASLYVSALGNCDAYLNGKRVSDERFTPGWTDYKKRVYYRTYDVTKLLKKGANALGAELADGWYSGYVGWGRNRNHYGSRPRVRLQLNIEYQDGSTEIIGTGPAWKAQIGPTREADFLMGENYDATLAEHGWCQVGADESTWSEVDTGAEVSPVLEAHPGPPVVGIQEFTPISINEHRPGTYVFDLGQNIAGVVRLKVNGEHGQKIKLRFAERLNPDGTLYTINLRGARTVDTYVCRGGGVETWEPRFTFHGFQYVEVTGLSEKPSTDTITGIALSSNTPRVGFFECSDAQLNRLHENILWTQYANFIDVPTDCPQRDERLGWTGDAQVYVGTACLNTDVHAFFKKWLTDLTDAQREDGQFPTVAPLIVSSDDGGPAWADAGVICPWTIYESYNDRKLLAQHYDSMKQFVEFCRNRSKDGVLPPEKFHCFGDWLSINADTPKEVIYTAYFANCARLVARSAEVLGHTDDAATYRNLYEDIKRAFNDAYVNEEGRVHGDTQCCYVLALANDLVEGKQRKQAAERLVADIVQRDYHLSTGFVGTKDLMLVLSKIGRNDIAYRLIHNDTFPSWGFSIKHGATSIWERWDGWTPERGFQDPGMNSFAHYSFGAVYQWMVENIGGIRRLEPGYKRFEIAPNPGGKLTWANVDYDSINGRISSYWKRQDKKFELRAEIPANTTALVRLPEGITDKLTVNGQNAADATGVVSVQSVASKPVLELRSGTYTITAEVVN